MIDLYAAATANGQKAAIMLEEVEAEYRTHVIDLFAGEHRQAAFQAINPTGKIPALVDGDQSVIASIPIALYLSDKFDRLKPATDRETIRMHEALSVVGTDLSPAFTGLFVHNVLSPEKSDFIKNFYEDQARRMLGALDGWLETQTYLAGETYTVADVIAYPHAATSIGNLLGSIDEFPRLKEWAERIGARAAVQKGMTVCA